MTAFQFFAFDLDGTLLDATDRPLAGIADSIAALARHGIVSVLATGRSPVSLLAGGIGDDLLRVLHPRMIVSDGDGVLDRESDLFRPLRRLPAAVVARLRVLPDLAVEIDGRYHATSRRAALGVAMTYRIPRASVAVTPVPPASGRVTRVLVFGPHQEVSSLLKGIPHSSKRLDAFGATLVRPVRASKATALTALLRADFGERDLDRVMAFGDGITDAELLASAGLGIAMQQSDPIALAAADHQLAEPLNDYLLHLIGGLTAPVLKTGRNS